MCTQAEAPIHPGLTERGLTKREYFAGLAMQGLCASDDFGSAEAWHVAKLAVAQADAIIAALNKESQS